MLLFVSNPGFCLPPFQLYIEITPEGGVVRPPAGRYAGPVIVNKRLTIEGGDEIIIDGEGEGSILTVTADGVVVRGLNLTNSGESHDQVDAAILIEADNTLIENNTIDNSLFGIHLRRANDNVIKITMSPPKRRA